MSSFVMSKTEGRNKKKVAQHNKLIHAFYSMDTYEYLVYIYMLCKISKKDKTFREVEIPIELIIGKNKGGRNYDLIQSAMEKLRSKVITVEKIFSKKDKELMTLSMFHYSKFNSSERVIRAKFDDRVAPYLLNLTPGNFTLSEMKDLLIIADYQSFRIYNLLKVQSFKTDTIFLTPASIIQMLQLSCYYKKNPSSIKIRIIEKAKKKLKNTEMAFDYSIKYKGRAIKGYELKILNKNIKALAVTDQENNEANIGSVQTGRKPCNNELYRFLLKIGVSEKMVLTILEEYDESHIIKCIEILNAKAKKEKLNNPAGYLIGVLKSASTIQSEIDFPNLKSGRRMDDKAQQMKLKDLVDELKGVFFESCAVIIAERLSASITEDQHVQFSNRLLKSAMGRKNTPLNEEGKVDVRKVKPSLAFIIFEEMGLVNKETEFISFFFNQTGLLLSKEDALASGYKIMEVNTNMNSRYTSAVSQIIVS